MNDVAGRVRLATRAVIGDPGVSRDPAEPITDAEVLEGIKTSLVTDLAVAIQRWEQPRVDEPSAANIEHLAAALRNVTAMTPIALPASPAPAFDVDALAQRLWVGLQDHSCPTHVSDAAVAIVRAYATGEDLEP